MIIAQVQLSSAAVVTAEGTRREGSPNTAFNHWGQQHGRHRNWVREHASKRPEGRGKQRTASASGAEDAVKKPEEEPTTDAHTSVTSGPTSSITTLGAPAMALQDAHSHHG